MFKNEIWKPLVYRDIKDIYEVSSFGRVRNIKSGKILKTFPLKTGDDPDNHQRISLRLADYSTKHNKKRTFHVHTLVAITFIPNPDNKYVIHHKDGNPENNHVDNLMWVTYSEHQILTYALEQRDRKYGDKDPNAKYTNEQYIKLAKLMSENKLNVRELSIETGISVNMIRSFIHGTVWHPEAREAFNIKKYTGLQSLNDITMEDVFKVISENPTLSNKKLSKLADVSEATISNVINRTISTRWKHLYDKYNIPTKKGKKYVIIINKDITKKVLELANKGISPNDIIKILNIEDNNINYMKIYRACIHANNQ